MTTYYYQPLPQMPDGLLAYCDRHHYPLSLKKKYIVSQLIDLQTNTDIDELLLKTSLYSNSISKSSVYQVLQWMIAHDLVSKTTIDDNIKVLYKTNFGKLNLLRMYYTQQPQHLTEYSNLSEVA